MRRRLRLGVNIDHVATVRQARRGAHPDPVEAALACVEGGADSIVCHLREDRRHIQDRDVARLIRAMPVPVNLEMSAASSVVAAALRCRPAQITLVPERREELTTEGGLDVRHHAVRTRRLIRRFHERDIPVSLFIDAAADQVRAAAASGARIIELHTGDYANTVGARRQRALGRLRDAATLARDLGLSVAGGHGLDYDNVRAVAHIQEIEELNIGFSIVSRAMFVGLESAVRRMRRLLAGGS
jgi:pyridoxine 5-phosphate synthase